MDGRRTDTADRHDDSDLIDSIEKAPAQSGQSGGNLQRDIGTRDEEDQIVGDGEGVTRVRASDKPREADLPRFNQK